MFPIIGWCKDQQKVDVFSVFWADAPEHVSTLLSSFIARQSMSGLRFISTFELALRYGQWSAFRTWLSIIPPDVFGPILARVWQAGWQIPQSTVLKHAEVDALPYAKLLGTSIVVVDEHILEMLKTVALTAFEASVQSRQCIFGQ